MVVARILAEGQHGKVMAAVVPPCVYSISWECIGRRTGCL
jgi:hypothetical protein